MVNLPRKKVFANKKEKPLCFRNVFRDFMDLKTFSFKDSFLPILQP